MNEVSPKEAQSRMQQGAILVDVREPNEYQEVHATGAQLMPLSEFESSYGTLPKDAEIVMICRSGARSERAGQMLLGSGYTNVSNLTGGTLAWVQDGLPTGDDK
ncbi:rhodanese-like domain-containing protein [Deinococcus altitudinis]|uniref:rhodanese-like domain-containing protein n=1 Tax=Deinococcus altitudinis TaxID=468914 RepID=UPI0038917F9F